MHMNRIGVFLRYLAFWFVGLASLASSGQAEEWPHWGGPRGDETWKGPRLPEKWPDAGLPVVWKREIGGGYGGVAISENRVYVMDWQVSPERERVLCFDAASGEPLWHHDYPVAYGKLEYGNGPRATPTLFDGRIYTLGAVGHFHCLDAATGKVLWSKDFVADFGARLPTWGLAASPVIWQNLVIVHPGAKPDGCLVAFDRISGNEMWRASADPAGYATPVLIQPKSGPQLVCWTPENILGMAPQTGEIEWRVPYKVTYGVSIAPPIFQKDIVFVSGYWEGSKAIRLGPGRTDAKVIWEDRLHLRGLMAQPLYRDGLVYSIDKQYGLTCFDLETGKKRWDDKNRLTPRGRNPQASLVWLGDDDRVIALNSEGDLILARLDGEGYHEQARTNIIQPTETARVWAHPGYAGRNIYARNDRELVCVSLLTPPIDSE
jgi:outer membrane protein assembly factor BamB